MSVRWWAIAVVAAACRTPPSSPPPSAPASVAAVDAPMSDPHEYAIERVSWQAGERIFASTGIGDPYVTGVPYPIWLALVRGEAARLGGSVDALAAKFGLLARAADPASADRDVREGLPIGLHLTDDPITWVAFVVHNCALCHAERVRWSGGEALVIGLGNKRLRVHALDAAFTSAGAAASVEGLATAAAAVATERGLVWPMDWQLPMVRATTAAFTRRAEDRAVFLARTAAGPPGRVATIEAFAVALEKLRGQRIDTAPVVGWAKIPDVIGFGARTTLSFDGAGDGPMDVLVVEADVAAGVRPAWYWAHPLQGASLGAYLRQPERDVPFPGPIDRARAARGRLLFDDNCAPCHGTYADDGRVRRYDEQIVPLADVGTDPARASAVTASFVAAASDPDLTKGLTRTRATGGYVPPVLTDAWMRAPYGHAGQWPSLAVLAQPPAARAERFGVDLDAPYDLVQVGVAVSGGAASGAGSYVHDGDAPGFDVGGHPFLSDLGPADAALVLEYLKTL